MGFGIDKIKQEFTRNKKRAAVLGILSLVLAGFSVKAYFDLAPRSAAAGESETKAIAVVSESEVPLTSGETDARMRQSQELWKVLRTTRGNVTPSLAFTFSPAYYNLDPSRPAPRVQSNVMEASPHVVATNVSNEEAERVARINELAKKLLVTSTVVGSGNSRPVAIVSGHIVAIGDRVDGFEVMAIKAGEVDFKMDGVTFVVTMADSAKTAGPTHGP